MDSWILAILPLLIGWLLDLLLGDPIWLPHPVVWFGKAIAACEHKLNRGNFRKAKGAFVAIVLIALVIPGHMYNSYLRNKNLFES